MEKNKKIYKYISIISFIMVIILIINTIMPAKTIADSENEINMEITYNKEANNLTVSGNISKGYTGYELYWVKGDTLFNSSSDVNEVIQWFKTNQIQTETQTNNFQISNTLNITENGTYTVLCIAKINDEIAMLKWASKTISEPIIIEEENTTQENVESEESNVEINIGKLNGNNQSIYLNVSSKTCKISELKYLITEQVVNNKDTLINEGTKIAVDSNEILIPESQNTDYISIYAIDEQGAFKFISKNISDLEVYDTLPWGDSEDEYEEIEEEEVVEDNKEEVKEEEKVEDSKEEIKEEEKIEDSKEEIKEEEKVEDNKEEVEDEQKTDENKESTILDDKDEYEEITENGIIDIDQLPQTGENQNINLIAICVFLGISVISFVKYKKID